VSLDECFHGSTDFCSHFVSAPQIAYVALRVWTSVTTPGLLTYKHFGKMEIYTE
jgi:hypothetical protein